MPTDTDAARYAALMDNGVVVQEDRVGAPGSDGNGEIISSIGAQHWSVVSCIFHFICSVMGRLRGPYATKQSENNDVRTAT